MRARRVLTRLTALAVLLAVSVPVDDSGLSERAATAEATPPENASGVQAGLRQPGQFSAADDAMSRPDCPPAVALRREPPASRREYLDERRRELRGIADKLSASRDPEHLLAAAILGTDKGTSDRIDALAVALDADPGRQLPLTHLFGACTGRPSAPVCAHHDIEKMLLQAGDSNGAHWAHIALYREAQGDLAEALEALAAANSASGYDNHWIESVMMLERSLAASTSYTYTERVAEAFGIAAAELLLEGEVLGACTRHASGSLEWRRICLSFGGMLEQKGVTVLGQAIGLGLQIKMLEISDSDASIAAAKQRQAQFRRELYDEMLTEGATFLMEHDANALSDYLSVFEVYGENSALQFARSEAERLKAVPGYEPCRRQVPGTLSDD